MSDPIPRFSIFKPISKCCLIWILENVPQYCSFKCRTNRHLKFCQETPKTWDLVKLSTHRVVTTKSSLFAINQWGWRFWRGSLLQLTYDTDQITIDRSGGASPSMSTHKTWLLDKVVQPPHSSISETSSEQHQWELCSEQHQQDLS